MNLFLARFFSLVFHPVFIPVYSILFIIYMFPYRYIHVADKTWNLTIGILIAMTVFIPSLIVFIMKKLKIVDDFDISVQKQRILPYLIFFFFYLMTFLTIRPKLNSSPVFMEDALIAAIILGATISLGIAFFLNNFLKVSVHTMGATNLFVVTLLLGRNASSLSFYLIFLAFIVMGCVGSARIYLRSHAVREVYYGIFCGIIGQLIAFFAFFDPRI